jgi:putative ABC transport system ATP-binding protein
MIAIRHLSMRLTAGGRRVTILDDVTLSIPPKQMVAVMGPSGSGKSTLLGLIAGLDRPTDGAIVLDGIDITTLSESRMAKFRRIKIGYIFQSFHLIPTLTALENVLVPLELAGDAAAKDLAAELLHAVGLQNRVHHYPVQLSGGEQSVCLPPADPSCRRTDRELGFANRTPRHGSFAVSSSRLRNHTGARDA